MPNEFMRYVHDLFNCTTLQFRFFLPRQKMPTRKKLLNLRMVIYVRKKNAEPKQAFHNFCWQNGNLRRQNRNLPRQNYFSLLLFSFTVQQGSLANTTDSIVFILSHKKKHMLSFCNTYDPCHVCHLQKEPTRKKFTAQKQQNTLN